MLLLRQAQIICKCLDHFCSHSGQRVSLNKSKLFLSPNISHSLASGISHILGIPLTHNLGKLGSLSSMVGSLNRPILKF